MSKPHLSPIVQSGDLFFVSGQLPFDGAGRLPEGIAAQSRQVMANLADVLGREGLGLGLSHRHHL